MCDIGDASRGSLSSYAYTLMVLFFLQQRNPPVIPVLQEVRVYDRVQQWEILYVSQLYVQHNIATNIRFRLQIYDGQKKPELLVDGWNVYFFDDLKALVSVLQFCMKSTKQMSKCVHHTILMVHPCSVQPLATVGGEHRDGGGAVARVAALLHGGVWLQRARGVYPPARPPHHFQQAVDI